MEGPLFLDARWIVGLAKTSNPSLRATATSVIPASSARAHGERCRRGHRDQDWNADRRGLLYQSRPTPGWSADPPPPRSGRRLSAGQRAGELIDRIVPADVFAHRDRSPPRRQNAAP